MRDALLDKWNRFSRREKYFCVAAGCVFMLYAAYAFGLEGLIQDILDKKARLAHLNTEYNDLQAGNRRQDELKKKLAMLRLELLRKKNEKHELFEGSQSRLPVETLLHELRQTAGTMSLQLADMDITTGVVSGTGGFPTGAAVPERVSFTVSKIALTYRSGYRDSVNYLLKVMDLPYGISVKTVEMTRNNKGVSAIDGSKKKNDEGGIPNGERPLNTRLGLEIFYR